MILKILTVAGLATFEIYAAIPAGLCIRTTSLGYFSRQSGWRISQAYLLPLFSEIKLKPLLSQIP